jgi:hypothetical protein
MTTNFLLIPYELLMVHLLLPNVRPAKLQPRHFREKEGLKKPAGAVEAKTGINNTGEQILRRRAATTTHPAPFFFT